MMMNDTRGSLCLIAAGFVLLGTPRAGAQPAAAEKGTVAGGGMVALKRRPDVLRMSVDVFAQGKTMKEALANLKDRREAVGGQLATLGAAKDSIVFGEPQVNAAVLESRRQMEAMIRNRLGNRAKKDPKKGSSIPTVVSARLTAAWPLKGKDTEALLVEIAQLQESINAADLAGRKDLEKQSTEDEELREELEGVQAEATNNNPNQPQPGTPAYKLVCKITAPEYSQALADSFRKAKSRAEETARAAGAELGPLRQIVAHTQAGGDSDGTDEPRQAYAQMMQTAHDDLSLEPEPVMEAQGAQPGEVSYRVAVSASFSLKERP